MPISVQCPGCKKKLTGKDELAGKRVKCPGCGHAVLIPAAQPAPQPKATKPAPQKLPVPNKADGITSPSPKKPPAAKKDDVVAAPVPASLERRIRWPWYAGGAAAVCLVAGLVFLLMPSKGRNASGDERPVLADASPAVVQPGNGAGEVDTRDLLREGPGDLALTYDVVHTDTTKHRGKRVTWAFTPCSSEGKRMLCALNRQEAMGPRHHGLYVVEFASDHEAGAVFRAAAFKPGSTITGTIAGNVDQFLVVRGGDGVPQKDVPKVNVPLLLYPTHKIGESDTGKGEEKVRQEVITKEKLVGQWEGKFANGTIKLTFYDDQLKQGEWWTGGIVLKVAGSVTVGAIGWKIDAEKNEVRLPEGVAKPTEDGALLFSGGTFHFGSSEYKVPKTRLERLKSELPAAPQQKTSQPGAIGGITEKLLGEWEGTLKDGTTLAVKFTEKLVVVSILSRGFDRKKARQAAEWASGDVLRRLGPGTSSAENLEANDWAHKNLLPALAGEFAIGSTAYKIDEEKNEIKFWGIQEWNGDGLAKPTNDGALLVSGDLRIATVPETRLERVKPKPSALPQPKNPPLEAKGAPKKTSLLPMMGGNFPKKSQTTPEKSKESEAGTEEIWPKKARAQYFEKPADLWAVFLTDAEKLPKGGPRAPWTRLLPTATKKLTVGVVFYREPAAATFSVRVLSKSGEVKLAETKQDFLMINSTYIRYVDLVPEKGTFAEGDYRAEVSINGKKIALVKWVIGKGSRDAAKPLTQREKLLLGKWRDAKNSAELGGGRFWGDMKFSDDGNLIITVKDTKTNKPAFLWATYKLLDDSTLEISIEGTSHDRVDIPGWGARELDMVRALLDEKPYTMKVSFAVSAKELTFAGVNYVRVEPGATGTP